jgi:hypothetical protein
MNFKSIEQKVKNIILDKLGDDALVILRFGSSLFPREFNRASDVDFFVLTKRSINSDKIGLPEYIQKIKVQYDVFSERIFIKMLKEKRSFFYSIAHSDKIIYSNGYNFVALKKRFPPDESTIRAETRNALIKYNHAVNHFLIRDDHYAFIDNLYKSLKSIFRALAWKQGLLLFGGKQIIDWISRSFHPSVNKAYKAVFEARKRMDGFKKVDQRVKLIKTFEKAFCFAYEGLLNTEFPKFAQILILIKKYSLLSPILLFCFDLKKNTMSGPYFVTFAPLVVHSFDARPELKSVFIGKRAKKKWSELQVSLLDIR